MNTLRLSQEYREGEQDGMWGKSARLYFDYVVSGQLLKRRSELASYDLIGALGWMHDRDYENRFIDELMGLKKPALSTGRTPIYICPECGDLGCGAITTKLEETDQTMIWCDFGYETDYSEPVLTGYEHIGPFEFDKVLYRQLFEKLRTYLNQ